MKALLMISALCLGAAAPAPSATKAPAQVPHQSDGDHAAGVDHRGDHAMGFSHETTDHHFTLLADGGTIQVTARADGDNATRDQIRMHLSHIAAMFAGNNFDIPMFIHGQLPPGVSVMKEKRGAITYTFEATERGGQVRIETHDAEAVKAVHDFLTFQILDHRTGDSLVVKTGS